MNDLYTDRNAVYTLYSFCLKVKHVPLLKTAFSIYCGIVRKDMSSESLRTLAAG